MLKVYQEKWYNDLLTTKNPEKIVKIAKKIVEDDSGDTCMLTQLLAKSLLLVEEKRTKEFIEIQNQFESLTEALECLPVDWQELIPDE